MPSEPLFCPRVPARGPLEEADPELVDQQRELLALRRPLARVRLDLGPEQPRGVGEKGPRRPHVGERLLGRQQVAEEEPEQPLVPVLEDPPLSIGEPGVERLLAFRRQPVLGPLARPSRTRLGGDQPGPFQPLQLRIDLPVARAPEEAGRELDHVLDVVARLRAEAEEAEDDSRSRAEVDG